MVWEELKCLRSGIGDAWKAYVGSFAVIATDAMIADMRASSYCIAGQSAESPKLATDVNLDSGSTVVPGIQEIEEDANGAAKH